MNRIDKPKSLFRHAFLSSLLTTTYGCLQAPDFNAYQNNFLIYINPKLKHYNY